MEARGCISLLGPLVVKHETLRSLKIGLSCPITNLKFDTPNLELLWANDLTYLKQVRWAEHIVPKLSQAVFYHAKRVQSTSLCAFLVKTAPFLTKLDVLGIPGLDRSFFLTLFPHVSLLDPQISRPVDSYQ